MDANGNIQWQKAYYRGRVDWLRTIRETNDGGYILAGSTLGYYKEYPWIVKLDANGNIQWQKAYDWLPNDEIAFSIQQTKDGGYGVIGISGSNIIYIEIDSTGNASECLDTINLPVNTSVTSALTINSNFTVKITPQLVSNEISSTSVTIPTSSTPIQYCKPIASFSFSPSNPTVGETVTFDASQSFDVDGTIKGWLWDFDGDHIADLWQQIPYTNYTYNQSGTYTVTLVVIDNNGLQASISKQITVFSDFEEPWQAYDENGDGHIQDSELINAIIDWLNGNLSDFDLINVIMGWLQG